MDNPTDFLPELPPMALPPLERILTAGQKALDASAAGGVLPCMPSGFFADTETSYELPPIPVAVGVQALIVHAYRMAFGGEGFPETIDGYQPHLLPDPVDFDIDFDEAEFLGLGVIAKAEAGSEDLSSAELSEGKLAALDWGDFATGEMAAQADVVKPQPLKFAGAGLLERMANIEAKTFRRIAAIIFMVAVGCGIVLKGDQSVPEEIAVIMCKDLQNGKPVDWRVLSKLIEQNKPLGSTREVARACQEAMGDRMDLNWIWPDCVRKSMTLSDPKHLQGLSSELLHDAAAPASPRVRCGDEPAPLQSSGR